jgi:catechol 2,3-dioxygenase-like lactoylglutathione lyase family enzyme
MAGPTRYHHVAFGTKDVEATWDFYANRLGMPLVHCENHLSGEGWLKHFFFDVGNGELLGFFAFANVGEKDGYRTDISTGLGLPRWVNHVAFNVESMDVVREMRERAEKNGVKTFMETDHEWCYSVYFVDPNGILVEFSTTTRPGDVRQAPERALALLRQAPGEFEEAKRKDASTVVKTERADGQA